jgi:mono/diheme cytochrome c family protein
MVPKIPSVLFFIMVCSSISAWAQAGGDVLYDAKCASCHGKDGVGKTAFAQKAHIPNLASPEVQSMSDKEIYESIARGTHHKEYPHAFAMRGMSDSEILSLVKRVRDFAKKK